MKIVFLDRGTLGAASLEPISRLGELVTYPVSSPQQARERVADADILIINKVVVDKALLDCAPKLKLICEAATGVNNIDVSEAASRGIPVMNVASYSTDSVVQITFALALSLICDCARFDREVKDGSYSRSGLFTDVSRPFPELSAKTWGIVGMGNIGQKVAGVAQSFGMEVIYFSTSGTSHCKKYPCVSLEELLSRSDVVSIHCPLNANTSGLVGEKQLALMKKSSVIINLARGGIIDEAALVAAVDNGLISGAGVDVFTKEPLPEDHPFMHIKHAERFIFSPHIGWASAEAIDRLVEGIAANIRSASL